MQLNQELHISEMYILNIKYIYSKNKWKTYCKYKITCKSKILIYVNDKYLHVRPTFYQKAKNFTAQLTIFIIFNEDI